MGYEVATWEDDEEDENGTRSRAAVVVWSGGLGLLLEEEAGGLDVATGSDGLHLGVLDILDDGLEPSTEGSSLGVVRHGDRTGQRTDSGGG
jgi:hypothetical protein